MSKGTRIKQCRENLGLSQIEVAESLGISKQLFYKYENDIVTNIPSDKVEALARILNTTPGYLMGWEEISINPAIADAADVSMALLNDGNMVEALKIYFSMNDDKKKHVIDTIYLLGGATSG